MTCLSIRLRSTISLTTASRWIADSLEILLLPARTNTLFSLKSVKRIVCFERINESIVGPLSFCCSAENFTSVVLPTAQFIRYLGSFTTESNIGHLAHATSFYHTSNDRFRLLRSSSTSRLTEISIELLVNKCPKQSVTIDIIYHIIKKYYSRPYYYWNNWNRLLKLRAKKIN